MVLIEVAELVVDVTSLCNCVLHMQVRHADACRRVFPVDPENSLVKPLLVKPALYNVRASDNVRLVQKPLSVVLQLRPEFSLV